MIKILIVFLIIVMVFTGCRDYEIVDKPEEDEKLNGVECAADNDCAKAGCSSQLCIAKDKAGDIRTTCEFREEYGCLELTTCSCIEGECDWVENEEYTSCLEGVIA